MSANCPTCGQPWPSRVGRVCTACGKPIGRRDKYTHIAGKVFHRDCQNPTLTTVVQGDAAQPLLKETVC